MNVKYGWIKDRRDDRDFFMGVHSAILKRLPPKVDLTATCPPVYDQGELGSCTANAIGAAHQFEQIKQSQTRGSFIPSRLFIYWNERDIEGTTDEDSGAMIRDGMKSIAKQGVCPEARWPYDVTRYRLKPLNSCYIEARDHQALTYYRVVQTLNQMKGCLAAGYPFVFGFSVFESFESPSVAKAGVVPMPGPGEQCLGGHAVLAVGFDDEAKRFLVQNSWGDKWGIAGRFTIPMDYLLDSNLSSDFWTVRLVE